MILLLPILQAELVKIDNVVRYRIHCDQCDEWHYHGPQDGHCDCHCSNPGSLYHRTGYFIELDECIPPNILTVHRRKPMTQLLIATIAVAALVSVFSAVARPSK